MEESETQFMNLADEWDNELELRYSKFLSSLDPITRFRLKVQPDFEKKLILLKNIESDESDLVAFFYHEGEYDNLTKKLITFVEANIMPEIKLIIETTYSIIENLIQALLNLFGSMADAVRFIKENNLIQTLAVVEN